MALKQDGANNFLCPKQGVKIEGVVVEKVSILDIFFVLSRVRIFSLRIL